MSYTKREWATGNVVGAVDLNRMEQGIEDASDGGAEPLIVNKVNTGTDLNPVMILDHTWQEIFDAYMLGKAVLIKEGDYDVRLVYGTSSGEIGYSLYTRSYTYVADEPNEHPVEN